LQLSLARFHHRHRALNRPPLTVGNVLRVDICEPDVTIELLKLFRSHNSCPAEHVHKLLGTPRMKEHLKAENNALLRLGIHLDTGQKRWSKRTA